MKWTSANSDENKKKKKEKLKYAIKLINKLKHWSQI